MLLISSSAIAYTPQEVVDFFGQHKPFENDGVDDNMVKICTTYVDSLFYDSNLKDFYVQEAENSTYIVRVVFNVGKPKPGASENVPEYLKDEVLNIKNELNLDWFVDINGGNVETRNTLASDCIMFYADMLSSQ